MAGRAGFLGGLRGRETPERDAGAEFGSDRPIEAPLLAALTTPTTGTQVEASPPRPTLTLSGGHSALRPHRAVTTGPTRAKRGPGASRSTWKSSGMVSKSLG